MYHCHNEREKDLSRTSGHPLTAAGEAIEREGRALVVSLCAGFPAADIHDIGPSVTVLRNGSYRKVRRPIWPLDEIA